MDKVQKIQTPTPQNRDKRLCRLTLTKSEFFSGPLPPPSILQGYEQACQGAAGRIIKLAEDQSGHRQKIENKVICSKIANERTSMFLSFYLTGGLLVAGIILLVLDKQVPGYLSLFGPMIFHAGNYLSTKNSEKTEIDKKTEQPKSNKKNSKKKNIKKKK